MKLKVTQENFNKALAVVSRVAASKASLPILANVLITAEKNSIVLAATNLEIAITYTLAGKVEKPGSITVPARLINDFVSSLPAGNIDMELDGSSLNLSTEHYQSTINGTSPDEFPSLPSIDSSSSHKLDSSKFRQALQQTVLAASSDEARQVLTGVLMKTHEKNLFLVATDSYRLAERKVGSFSEDLSLIIPASSLQEVLRVISDEEAELEMAYDEGQVKFDYGDIQVISRLIDGNFPDYRQLIPKKNDVEFSISRDDFINITKVSSLFARESAGSITLEVSEADQEVSIQSIASQVGENTSKATAKVKGDGKVTLNSRFLMDALNAFNASTVSFSFSGKINPCVITEEGGGDYLHIVMPLKS